MGMSKLNLNGKASVDAQKYEPPEGQTFYMEVRSCKKRPKVAFNEVSLVFCAHLRYLRMDKNCHLNNKGWQFTTCYDQLATGSVIIL